MLTEIYIEAFDEELADQVWEAWDVGEIDDLTALWLWWSIVRITVVRENSHKFPFPTFSFDDRLCVRL